MASQGEGKKKKNDTAREGPNRFRAASVRNCAELCGTPARVHFSFLDSPMTLCTAHWKKFSIRKSAPRTDCRQPFNVEFMCVCAFFNEETFFCLHGREGNQIDFGREFWLLDIFIYSFLSNCALSVFVYGSQSTVVVHWRPGIHFDNGLGWVPSERSTIFFYDKILRPLQPWRRRRRRRVCFVTGASRVCEYAV